MHEWIMQVFVAGTTDDLAFQQLGTAAGFCPRPEFVACLFSGIFVMDLNIGR
jgi:hypothetical protein